MLQAAALRVGSLSCGPSLSATRRVFSLSAALHARLHIPCFLPDDFPANTYIHPHHHHPSHPFLSTHPPRIKNTMASNPYVVPDSDNDDDPDLALAIKLSLQEGPQPQTGSRSLPRRATYPSLSVMGESSKSAAAKRKADLIVISDTESDEDTAPPSKKSQKIAVRDDDNQRDIPSASSSLLGLDRSQMERERLARLSIKSPVSAPLDTRGKLRGIVPLAAQRNDGKFVSVGSFGKMPAAATTTNIAAPRASHHALEFPDGVVKKTWVFNTDRDGTDIKFEEVLRKETLIGAVLSAFQWDHEWLWTKIPDGKLQRFVLVMQAKGEAERAAILEVLGGLPKTTIVFPNMEKGNHCMHSKLMLLFHRNRDTGVEWLRIAIPSANLTDYDWGEGGTMENTVFIIDLPKIRGPAMPEETMFQKELAFFCKASDYPVDILTRLSEYDFSATAPLAFVHTICGTHYGPIITRTGYGGLGTAISALGYNSGNGLELDAVSSSIGATDKAFIMHMYRAAQGSNGIAELARRPPVKILTRKERERLPKPKLPRPVKGGVKRTNWDDDDTVQAASESDTESGDDEETSWGRVKSLFRLHFPSHNTVATSKGGTMGAGTLCCMKENWEKSEYPRSVLRDCKSVREGIVMHNKILFARPARTALAKSGRRVEAWAYVGSANFTVSAW